MENLTRDVAMYIKNEMRLLEIEAENNVLLQRINELETRINLAKQRFEQPCLKDITVLNATVTKSLHLLAERDTITIVGNSLITQRVLHRMIENRHQYLTDKFKRRLFNKRFERCKRLHHINFNFVQ